MFHLMLLSSPYSTDMQEESQTIVTRGVKNDRSMNIALAKPEVWLT